jgi:hypothetical protein
MPFPIGARVGRSTNLGCAQRHGYPRFTYRIAHLFYPSQMPDLPQEYWVLSPFSTEPIIIFTKGRMRRTNGSNSNAGKFELRVKQRQ